MKKIKYLLVVLSIFLIGIINVSAKIPETKNRDELENLGVNKKWNITDSNKANVLKTKAVNADDKIYDFSDVLTDEEYEKLKSEAIDFKNHTIEIKGQLTQAGPDMPLKTSKSYRKIFDVVRTLLHENISNFVILL